jgi:hypothetical protein
MLKQISLFALLVGSFHIAAMAQRFIGWGASTAVELNYQYQGGTPGNSSKARLGFAIDGFANIGLKGKLSLLVGLGYAYKQSQMTMKNVTFNNDGQVPLGGNGPSRIDMQDGVHELQLPVLLQFNLQSPTRGIFLGGGPMLACAVSSETLGQITYPTGQLQPFSTNVPNNRMNLALQVNVGDRIPLNEKTSIGIEVYGNGYGKGGLYPANRVNAGLRGSIWF